MAVCEAIAELGIPRASYLRCAYRLSKTITQGTFEEGFIFLPRYFVEVEQAIGIVLLTLLAGYVVQLAWKLYRTRSLDPDVPLTQLFLVAAAVYLVRAGQSNVLHWLGSAHALTFTGRYVAIFFPFVVWAAVSFVMSLSPLSLRQVVFGIAGLASVATLATYEREYRHLAYPPHVLYECGIRAADVVAHNHVYETTTVPGSLNFLPGDKGVVHSRKYITVPNDERFILVNAAHLGLECALPTPFRAPTNATLLFEGPHFLMFRANGFEGYSVERRREFADRRYRVAIYRVNSDRLGE
jgi:hypothetical protein